jgi:hypothetical protein
MTSARNKVPDLDDTSPSLDPLNIVPVVDEKKEGRNQ